MDDVNGNAVGPTSIEGKNCQKSGITEGQNSRALCIGLSPCFTDLLRFVAYSLNGIDISIVRPSLLRLLGRLDFAFDLHILLVAFADYLEQLFVHEVRLVD